MPETHRRDPYEAFDYGEPAFGPEAAANRRIAIAIQRIKDAAQLRAQLKEEGLPQQKIG